MRLPPTLFISRKHLTKRAFAKQLNSGYPFVLYKWSGPLDRHVASTNISSRLNSESSNTDHVAASVDGAHLGVLRCIWRDKNVLRCIWRDWNVLRCIWRDWKEERIYKFPIAAASVKCSKSSHDIRKYLVVRRIVNVPTLFIPKKNKLSRKTTVCQKSRFYPINSPLNATVQLAIQCMICSDEKTIQNNPGICGYFLTRKYSQGDKKRNLERRRARGRVRGQKTQETWIFEISFTLRERNVRHDIIFLPSALYGRTNPLDMALHWVPARYLRPRPYLQLAASYLKQETTLPPRAALFSPSQSF
jgi:hypothetical protein